MTRPSLPCPCGAGAYETCCGKFIEGGDVPATAEQLMRSRYTAYVMHQTGYLRRSWHPSTCPAEPIETDVAVKWLGLEVRQHISAGERATVEFVARYKVGGRAQRLHEVSRFVREEGRWYYLDGSFPENKKRL